MESISKFIAFLLIGAIVLTSNSIPTTYADNPKVYEIQYELNGGSIPDGYSNPTTYSAVSTFSVINPVRLGYEFNGWSGTGIETTTSAIKVSNSHGDKYYEANWKIANYAIEIDLDGGKFKEGEEPPSEYSILSDTITIGIPEKYGYLFDHWEFSNGMVFEGTIPSGTAGDLVVKAVWVESSYGIAYRLGGGVLEDGKSNPTSYTVNDSFTLNNPTKIGYTFDGWTEKNDPVPDKEKKIEKGTTESLDFTAEWSLIYYDVAIDLNGGSFPNGYVAPIVYSVESSINLPDPMRTGYKFAGWATGDSTSLVGGASTATGPGIVRKGSVGNRSFTALWELEVYDIEYDLDGGSFTEGVPEKYSITDDDVIITNPVKDGYRFIGWTGSNLTVLTTNLVIKSGSYGSISLHANWIQNDRAWHQIMTELDGGRSTDSIPVFYFCDVDTPISNPTRMGYDFLGWSVNGSDPIVDYVIKAGTTTDLQLVAKWKAKVYKITYKLAGGTFSSKAKKMNPQTYTIEDSFKIVNPTRYKYLFDGWINSYNNGFDTEMTIDKGTVGDLVLKAVWIKSKVPDTFVYAHMYKTLNMGSNFKINLLNTKGYKVSWRQSNSRVASVSGVRIKTKSVGTTEMICTVKKGNTMVYRFGIKLTVQKSRSKTYNTSHDLGRFKSKKPIVVLDKSVVRGSPTRINFKHAENATIIYKVDNPKIATIKPNGTVVGKRSGYTYAVINVKKDGKKTEYVMHLKVE